MASNGQARTRSPAECVARSDQRSDSKRKIRAGAQCGGTLDASMATGLSSETDISVSTASGLARSLRHEREEPP
jgi:hypothetical protein